MSSVAGTVLQWVDEATVCHLVSCGKGWTHSPRVSRSSAGGSSEAEGPRGRRNWRPALPPTPPDSDTSSEVEDEKLEILEKGVG